jgi:hypothetical protein
MKMSDHPQLKDMNVGLYATPDSMKALQDYLALFSGGEAAVAQVAAWMAWNLACKYAQNESDARNLIKEHESTQY